MTTTSGRFPSGTNQANLPKSLNEGEGKGRPSACSGACDKTGPVKKCRLCLAFFCTDCYTCCPYCEGKD